MREALELLRKMKTNNESSASVDVKIQNDKLYQDEADVIIARAECLDSKKRNNIRLVDFGYKKACAGWGLF